ncbi:MAG: glycosyltransferase family 2 protein [Gammaproteobacteria bacterium]|nr:glycosyltransferase family 2 protein [Gammaproteobacteria bacterium]
MSDRSIAVAIPCLNEAPTVAAVAADFRAAFPAATIYVYDNGSTDGTAQAATAAGAVVRSETTRGKGNVVRRIFADVDAEVFVLVDGDATYPASAAPAMVATLVDRQLDMVSGARTTSGRGAYRPGHRVGNALITGTIGLLFGRRFRDILTGYRVLSRRFVKSFPALSAGFEIETEIAVHALQMRLPATEVDVPYSERPTGSPSKLRTVRDGLAIARTILVLIKEEKPFPLFAGVAVAFEAAATAVAWPLLAVYLATGLVPRLPTAVLATGLALLGALSLAAGVLLDAITRGRREAKRLQYLRFPAPGGDARDDESRACRHS